MFPKNSGNPQIIHFNRVFHYFHHPFWGTPIFGNTHICIAPRICMPPFPQRTRALKQIAPHAFDVQRPQRGRMECWSPKQRGGAMFFPPLNRGKTRISFQRMTWECFCFCFFFVYGFLFGIWTLEFFVVASGFFGRVVGVPIPIPHTHIVLWSCQ